VTLAVTASLIVLSIMSYGFIFVTGMPQVGGIRPAIGGRKRTKTDGRTPRS
jgi:hypothetical protein